MRQKLYIGFTLGAWTITATGSPMKGSPNRVVWVATCDRGHPIRVLTVGTLHTFPNCTRCRQVATGFAKPILGSVFNDLTVQADRSGVWIKRVHRGFRYRVVCAYQHGFWRSLYDLNRGVSCLECARLTSEVPPAAFRQSDFPLSLHLTGHILRMRSVERYRDMLRAARAQYPLDPEDRILAPLPGFLELLSSRLLKRPHGLPDGGQ